MTDELETPPPDFIKGLNEGYLLAKRNPELAQEIAEALPDSTRGNAFKKGREQLLSEKQRDKDVPDISLNLPDWLQKDRSRFDDPDIGKEDIDREL